MIYSDSIEVSADTTAGSPQEATLKLTSGVIHRFAVTFPPGCAGLAGVSFWIRGHPIFPSTAGQWFVADGRTIAFDEFLTIKSPLNIVTVKAYNTDDTYTHTLYYEFGVLKEWQVSIYRVLSRLVRLLGAFIGKKGVA